MRRFSGKCLTLCALVGAAPASAATTDDFYNPGSVSAIDISLGGAELAALAASPRDYVDGEVTITIGAETIGPLVAQVKLKGHGSFQPIGKKAAFTIKFQSGSRPFGGTTKGLTLNNMTQDPSMMHETLGFAVMRAAGVPAPRTGYAHVSVNGTGYGLYLNLERFDTALLDRLFPGNTGHLYEADTIGVDLRPGQAATFEVDEGDEANISDLEALIAAIDSPAPWWDAMAPYADLDQMTKMWAVEHFIGQWDGYSVSANPGALLDPVNADPSNYYLHSDLAGRFSMLPTGLDQSFTLPYNGLLVRTNRSRLVNACGADPVCRERFLTHLVSVGAAADSLDIGKLIEQLATVIAPARTLASVEPRIDDAAWHSAVDATRAFIPAQRAALTGLVTAALTPGAFGAGPWGTPAAPDQPGDQPLHPGLPGMPELPGGAAEAGAGATPASLVIAPGRTGVVDVPQSNTLTTITGDLGGVELRLPRGAVVTLRPDAAGTRVRVRGQGVRVTLGGSRTMLTLSGSRNVVTAAGKARQITAKGSRNRIRATRAAVRISAGPRAVVTTGRHADRITTGAGSTVNAGAGNDRVTVTSAGAPKQGRSPRSRINLGAGDDRVWSGNGIADRINGGKGSDRAITFDARDALRSIERRGR